MNGNMCKHLDEIRQSIEGMKMGLEMLKKTQYDMPKFKSLMNQIKDQRKGLLNTRKVINQRLKSRQNLHM